MTDVRQAFRQLHAYCAAREWRGWDPYDGLNSPVAAVLPGRWARQAWTQLHRRSRINLRPLCGIRPTLNAKALALFALGSGDPQLREPLRRLRNADGGWGYPFAWQSRAFYAPAGTSNLICTAFAARALGCDVTAFVENNLLRERAGERWVTYIPGADTQVHNINLIGAALLRRRDCAEFTVRRQRPNGSWWYGEAANQRWIDNFHTGYGLVALKELGGFAEATRRGYAFWEQTFWRADGEPLYYHDRRWPVDIHCCAQGILTFLEFDEPQRARRVAQWTLENMWDERGFFWYQRGARWVNRISYMRWAQAWMYAALARLIQADETANR